MSGEIFLENNNYKLNEIIMTDKTDSFICIYLIQQILLDYLIHPRNYAKDRQCKDDQGTFLVLKEKQEIRQR